MGFYIDVYKITTDDMTNVVNIFEKFGYYLDSYETEDIEGVDYCDAWEGVIEILFFLEKEPNLPYYKEIDKATIFAILSKEQAYFLAEYIWNSLSTLIQNLNPNLKKKKEKTISKIYKLLRIYEALIDILNDKKCKYIAFYASW